MRQIVLDTETTGISFSEGHRIIEIGCIEMIDRKVTSRHFHYYINPERDIDAGALAVHGISSEFLTDKPLFAEIVDNFLEYIHGAELIIHNASFDLGFLNGEIKRIYPEFLMLESQHSVIDTLVMARRKHAGQKNSLDALCKRYNVDLSERELHGALLDARLLAQVYLIMTGGQINLFEMEVETPLLGKIPETDSFIPKRQYDLPYIHLSEEEKTLHEQYLETLKKEGNCLWKEIEKQ